VQPGDTVVLQTLDALGVDRTGAQRGEALTLRAVLSGWRTLRPATRSK
jgi:hypothetical protein